MKACIDAWINGCEHGRCLFASYMPACRVGFHHCESSRRVPSIGRLAYRHVAQNSTHRHSCRTAKVPLADTPASTGGGGGAGERQAGHMFAAWTSPACRPRAQAPGAHLVNVLSAASGRPMAGPRFSPCNSYHNPYTSPQTNTTYRLTCHAHTMRILRQAHAVHSPSLP